jgi:DNA (cytosine-5)-methyltransferase 1
MVAYYNEIDPYAAQWLRNLIAAGHIASGDVDERPIQEVNADDIRKYTQCHFFAGIGGWSYALRLAEWEDERPVWTGSCPCQPFSTAGKQKGHGDERHLWPHWYGLIRKSGPSVIFGEQVTGAISFGWLDEVFINLEKEKYACAAALLPACGVGAPHKRERLWFVADSDSRRFSRSEICKKQQGRTQIVRTSKTFPHPTCCGWEQRDEIVGRTRERETAEGKWNRSANGCEDVANTASEGLQGQWTFRSGITAEYQNSSDLRWWEFEPSVGRVANGVPARAHKLRAYGNAIVPQVAAEFISAFMKL